jgi:hypothetical protein
VATFADRLLVHLGVPANLAAFLGGIGLDNFLTADFQARLNSDFWQVAQVVAGAVRAVTFEQPLWIEQRIVGREDHQGGALSRTNVDYKLYGRETALWADAIVELDTTWQVDQFPGTVVTSEAAPPAFTGLANLVSVLRLDANNRPLDPSGASLGNITLDAQGRLQADGGNPIPLRLDPVAGALLRPDGTIETPVLLELFPRVGPAVPLLGAPLGEDGQPLRDLRMDSRGAFTDLAGAAAGVDPQTGLPLDGAGNPVRPARLAIPSGGTTDYRFSFALPVQTGRLTLQLVTRLYVLLRPELDLVEDLRGLRLLRRRLEDRNDYLLSLNDTAGRSAHAFVLVYESDALGGSGLSQAEVRGLGARMGVLMSFFAEP